MKFNKKRHPTFAIVLLIIGLIWLLDSYFGLDLPIWPIIIIIVAVAWIIGFYSKHY